jgi:pimeloyl-ACP methyl ester carboxylesterase
MSISCTPETSVTQITTKKSDGKKWHVTPFLILDDVHRFMFDHRIGMATLAGHGIGAKVALATACYHHEYVTGYFAIASTPYDQFYYEPNHELRRYITHLGAMNIQRPFASISNELKKVILCPKWRSIFLNCLVKGETGYKWNFNAPDIFSNLHRNTPNCLTSWSTVNGLYPGRSHFVFPEYSRYVHLSTNTLPMYKVCPKLVGMNQDIFTIQGDENPLSKNKMYIRPLGLRQ